MDSLVVGNTATVFGGGIFLNGATAIISNTTISGNEANLAGGFTNAALDSNGANLTLSNSTITGNIG